MKCLLWIILAVLTLLILFSIALYYKVRKPLIDVSKIRLVWTERVIFRILYKFMFFTRIGDYTNVYEKLLEKNIEFRNAIEPALGEVDSNKVARILKDLTTSGKEISSALISGKENNQLNPQDSHSGTITTTISTIPKDISQVVNKYNNDADVLALIFSTKLPKSGTFEEWRSFAKSYLGRVNEENIALRDKDYDTFISLLDADFKSADTIANMLQRV